MAIYHLNAQIISRSKGRSTVAAAAYRSGQRLYDKRLQKYHQFRKRFIQSYILAPKNAPEWVYNREKLWNFVEKTEKRKDAQLSRELNIALPRELSNQQQTELALSFVKEQFVDLGMIADIAIHRDDPNNPHFHVMLTMREITPNGFAKKKNRDWNKKKYLLNWRKNWAIAANNALQDAGYKEKIDHRSYEKQGIPRLPTVHMGIDYAKEKKALQLAEKKQVKYHPVTKTGRLNYAIRKLNKELSKQTKFSLYANKDVQKRAKQGPHLLMALKNKKILLTKRDQLIQQENLLKKQIDKMQEVQKIYQVYMTSAENTIQHDRARIQLTRAGFTPTNFENEFSKQLTHLKAQITILNKKKRVIQKGLQQINKAINICERLIIKEMKLVYQEQFPQTLKYKPIEMYWILEAYHEQGKPIPVKSIDSFLQQRKQIKSTTLSDQYKQLINDYYYLENLEKVLAKNHRYFITMRQKSNNLKRLFDSMNRARTVVAKRVNYLCSALNNICKVISKFRMAISNFCKLIKNLCKAIKKEVQRLYTNKKQITDLKLKKGEGVTYPQKKRYKKRL